MSSTIEVTSHVARDFLQNSAYFNTVPKVVWEYVSNAVDNPRPNQPVNVEVRVSKQRIAISDDGCGMSRDGLRNFFQMHGENIRREKGERVRGMYGTGKCAAFGIADTFRLETCRNNVLNIVELTRKNIENSRSGQPFPITDIVVEKHTTQDDGTRIIISQLNMRSLDLEATKAYVERHLGRQLQNHKVAINDHICEYEAPYYNQEKQFKSSADLAKIFGDITLVVKVSPVPLDKERAGIDILSRGIWHDTRRNTVEGDIANRIFGEVDVPALEDKYDEQKIPPFDNTRNMTLNIQNPMVVSLLGWIDECLHVVARELTAAEKERRATEEAKRLASHAQALEKLLNEDFRNLEMELEKIRRLARQRELNTTDEPVPGGGELPTPYEVGGPEHDHGTKGTTRGTGETEMPGDSLLTGNEKGSLGKSGERKQKQSTFHIDYRHDDEQSPRSHYERETRTIAINLDHPQITSSLREGGIDGRLFREMSREVAIIEYAIALVDEELKRDPFYSGSDARYFVRETINRVTRMV